MDFVKLKNGMELPSVGLGTFPLHGDVLKNTLDMALSIGYRLIDTAHKYKNEREIGASIDKDVKNNLFFSSKICAIQYCGRTRYLHLNKRSVEQCYRSSCKKLGVEKLSLYLLHSCFPNCEKAYSEMIKLYENGKVDAIGVCNARIEDLVRIKEACGQYPMVVQVEVHPLCNQNELIAFCNANEIRVMAHSPFTHGDAMNELLSNPTLRNIAVKHNKTVAQIILRWIAQQGMIVIPRSTNFNRLENNIDIFDFTLSEVDMSDISSLNKDQSYGVRSKHLKE